MRIRTSTHHQVGGSCISQISFYQFRWMGGIVDLYTVERNLSTHLVEQIRSIKREFLGFQFPTTRMRNDGNSSTAMDSLYRLRHIHLEFTIPRITNHGVCARPIRKVAMLDEQVGTIAGHPQFACLRLEYFLAVRKPITSADQFLIYHLRIGFLALPNPISNSSQAFIVRIEAIAEHICHLPMPCSTDLHTCKNSEVFLFSQLLDTGNRIHTVVICDGDQAKAFLCQIVNKLFG